MRFNSSAPSSLSLILLLSSSLSSSWAFHVSRSARSIEAARPPSSFVVVVPPPASSATATPTKTTTTTTTLRADVGQEEGGGGYELPVQPGTHDELLYALGVNLARQIGDVRPLVEDGEELTQVARGLLDAVVGRLDDVTQRQLLASRGKDLDALIVDRANKIRVRMEEQGRAMLDNMSQTENIIRLDNGVLIDVLEYGRDGPGQGTRPTAASSVRVHYHGTLPDGTIFDTTLGGEPASFALGQVIPGWKSALLNMHEGETAVIGIPPEQAYGEAGTPDGRIPGGATLFFKVQLLEVLSAGIGGSPSLLGADGRRMTQDGSGGGGLLGPDGRPL